jgi:hypothetical protein
MKFILFEVYYRIFYTIGAISIIECFSYFVLGHQLEYFSGLLAFNYQAVDFDSYGDLRRVGFRRPSSDLEQYDCFLLFESAEQARICEDRAFILKPQFLNDSERCELDKQASDFLVLSPNEGRAWFNLFIAYLSYFYCLEVDKTTLNTMLMYIKLINFCILTITQTYSVCIPALLKKWAGNHFFILVGFMTFLLSSKSAIFILTASSEELQLEQLDSELL